MNLTSHRPSKNDFLDRNEGAADDREDLHLAQPDEDLADPLFLHVHPGDADDVVLAERFPVDLLDVFVEQVHVVVAAKPRHRGERARDHRAALVARVERQGILESPVGWIEARIDQADRKRLFRPAGGYIFRQQRQGRTHP